MGHIKWWYLLIAKTTKEILFSKSFCHLSLFLLSLSGAHSHHPKYRAQYDPDSSYYAASPFESNHSNDWRGKTECFEIERNVHASISEMVEISSFKDSHMQLPVYLFWKLRIRGKYSLLKMEGARSVCGSPFSNNCSWIWHAHDFKTLDNFCQKLAFINGSLNFIMLVVFYIFCTSYISAI